MGCDIHAWLEIRYDNQWSTPDSKALDLDRAYDTFGLFFGVRNQANVSPVAERRGFPRDASALVCQEYQKWSDDAHSASWLTWADVESMDRERVSARFAHPRVRRCRDVPRHVCESSRLTPLEYMALARGETVTKDGHLFCREHVKALDNLFDRLASHARSYAGTCCRLRSW